MTALAADTTRDIIGSSNTSVAIHKVLTSVRIYKGALLCSVIANGYAQPIVQSLTTPSFLGIALHGVATPSSSGVADVEVSQIETIKVAAITGADGHDDVTKTVYAADDGTGLTLTDTNNVPVGKIVLYRDGFFHVRCEAAALRSV